MTTSNTILVGCIYPGVEPFLGDFFESIKSQTTQDYDVLIISDNLELKDAQKLPPNTKIIQLKQNITPAQIRLKAIECCKENKYQYIIFTDVDDFFSANRVELSKIDLQNYDFVFNEIDLVDINGHSIRANVLKGINIRNQYNKVNEIIDKNLFGLSNTAVSLNALNELTIPKEIIAVDWWIFTILLLNKQSGKFIEKAKTYYRQTNNNTVGMWQPLDDNRLFKGIEVKTIHYKNVYQYCKEKDIKETMLFKQKLEQMRILNKEIRNESFRKKYINMVNKNMNDIYKGWWSEIIPLFEWRKYEN
jgi:hypothetical protein